MKAILSILSACAVAALWLWLKYWQAKKVYTRDLGDGGIQKLFDKNSK
jgi:hypothetical protein